MKKAIWCIVLLLAVLFLVVGFACCEKSDQLEPTESFLQVTTEIGTTNREEDMLQTEKTELKQPEEDSAEEETAETHEAETTQGTDSHMHSYMETKISASCTSKGYTEYRCSCGESYKGNYTQQTSHSYTSRVVNPTTSAQGYTVYTCTVCGTSYKDNYTAVLTEATKPKETTQATTQQTEIPMESTKPAETKPSETSATTQPTETSQTTTASQETSPPATQAPETNPPETTKPAETEPPKQDIPSGGSGNEDYGVCPDCGRRFWTSSNPTGCFSYMTDTVCECGVLVRAMECHHH